MTGADDPRLGTVHVVLLSHAHADHIGDQKLKAPDAGTCDNPEVVSAAPNSTTAEIAAAKNAALVMMLPMAAFLGRKMETLRGKLRPASRTAAFLGLVKGRPVCPALSGKTRTPLALPLTLLARRDTL